jgi:ABC-type glycerol-3-phosphate transport system substrate-binding protein
MKESSRQPLAIAFALVITLVAAGCGGGGSGSDGATEVTATTVNGSDTTTPATGGEISEP